jgi:hypothetical protein
MDGTPCEDGVNKTLTVGYINECAYISKEITTCSANRRRLSDYPPNFFISIYETVG